MDYREDAELLAEKVPNAFYQAQNKHHETLAKRDVSEYTLFLHKDSRKVHFNFTYTKDNAAASIVELYCQDKNLKIIGYFSQFDIEEMTNDQIAEVIYEHLLK